MLILSIIYNLLKVMKVLTQKKYQDHIPCSFAYRLVCVYDEFAKPIVVFRGGNAAYEFIKAIFKECHYCNKVIQKHFNIATCRFRGKAYWSCNIQLNKKVPKIFHNLRGYDSHLVFFELNKSDVKISVIPNKLEKYMTFF